MIGNLITIENKKSGAEVKINDFTNRPNVIALTQYPLNNPDIRVNDIPHLGNHGSHKMPSYYGGRTIILNGSIVGDDEATVYALKKNLDDVLRFEIVPDFAETLEVKMTDPLGRVLVAGATMSGATSYARDVNDPNILNFQITMRSNNFFMIIDGEVTDVTGLLGYEISGFKIATKLPFKFEKSFSEVKNINVDEPCFTKVRMYGSDDGDVVNPRLRNLDNGDDIIFFYTLQGSDEWIEVDGITGKMTNHDGQDMTTYLTSGDYLNLQVGNNRVAYLSSLSGGVIPPQATFTLYAQGYTI